MGAPKYWVVRDIDRGLGNYYLAPEGTPDDEPLKDFCFSRVDLLPRGGDVNIGDKVRIRFQQGPLK